MQDKRCKHKLRECKDFYLFIKHKKSHIYYAKFPEHNKCISTGETDIRSAYKKAYQIFYSLGVEPVSFHKELLDMYKDGKKKYYNMVKRISDLMSDVKSIEQVSLSRLVKLQEQLSDTGLSGKSVNNYMWLLRRLWKNREYNPFSNLSPVGHSKNIRGCFPVSSFKGFRKYIDRHKYLLLPYIAISTGMRVGEFKTAEPLVENGKQYIKVNGTKTEYSVRKVPVSRYVLEAYLSFREYGFASASWRKSVYMAGSLTGFDSKFIEENNIVFHSFRKMFKTILESKNINNLWIEYFMGHSILQSNDVNKLYFNPMSADDSLVYKQVLEAMSFLD